MAAEGGTPTELDLARQRLARSRAQVQRQFSASAGGSGAGLSPLVRGLALRGVQALTSGGAPAGNGMRVALAVAALIAMVLTRGRAGRAFVGGPIRGIGLALSLLLALVRFARRR